MVDVEGVGEAVTGGMIARAVEPQAGEGTGQVEGRCLNCGTELVGPHCHNCGQKGHVHRTLTAWWHDFLHGVLHLDGKLWHTLPLLVWRPGDLTRRYVEGERARFVSPLALFLFSVFLMFALFSAMGDPVIGIPDSEEARREVAAEVRQADAAIARLEAKAGQAGTSAEARAKVEAELRQARAARKAMETFASGGQLFSADVETGWPRLDRGLRKANENPSLLFYKLQTNAYKFSWALIPLSMPFLWVLFLHRKRYRVYKGYDHLVFVTYSISFMSLTLIAVVLLRAIGIPGGLVNWIIVVVPPVHIYRQLRGAYRLGRWSALWRTAFLLWFAGIAVTLFMILLLAMGVLA